MTDRFIRAVDQLGQQGDSNIQLRVGGIYALERLMRDSPDDQPVIIEVITAFLRGGPATGRTFRSFEVPPSRRCDIAGITADNQAAMTVLNRRNREHDDGVDIDLHGACLGRADLAGFDLDRVNLAGTDLRSANLIDSSLRGATLNGADLTRAELGGANLSCSDGKRERRSFPSSLDHCATLTRTRLLRARMSSVDLNGATLLGTDLRHAEISDADLSMTVIDDARMQDANLRGSNLTSTFFLGAFLDRASLEDTNLKGVAFNAVSLRNATLASADVRGADFRQAHVDGAIMTNAIHDRHTIIGGHDPSTVKGAWWD